MLTFRIPWKRGIGGELSTRTVGASYGDGYAVQAPDGINPQREQWDIETIPLDPCDAALFRKHMEQVGIQPFVWANPYNQAQSAYYWIRPYKVTPQQVGNHTVFKFRIETWYGVAS